MSKEIGNIPLKLYEHEHELIKTNTEQSKEYKEHKLSFVFTLMEGLIRIESPSIQIQSRFDRQNNRA